MRAIQPIEFESSTAETYLLLDTGMAERSNISNMLKTMAPSPRTLEGHLQFIRALNGNIIGPQLRELIALTVAQANLCEHSLAQHARLARELGLTKHEIMQAREARAADEKTGVALKFARNLITGGNDCSMNDCSMDDLREAGYSDSEIVEITAQVALSSFESYCHLHADLHFPKVRLQVKAA